MTRRILAAAGVSLIAAAVCISNAVIETGFAGRSPGSLAWGPTLFRVLLGLHGVVLIAACRVAPGRASDRSGFGRLFERWQVLALAGLSLLALSLRLWKLNSCLWLDEVFTLTDFVRPPFAEIITSFPNQNQHMLYSLLAHFSTWVFGESAWALRLPSVLFGVVSLWALFLLGRRVVGQREALLACALMTVSYHHIWFSQNARGYMGLLLFATLATWLWLEALSEDRWDRWICYAFACFLGLWIHLTMVFVVVTHALLWLVQLLIRPRSAWGPRLKPLAAWLLAGSLSLQVYALALPEFLRSAAHEVSARSDWTNPLWVVSELARGLRVGSLGIAVLACGGILMLVGWRSILRRETRAAFAMVLPALLGGGSMLALEHNLWPRFFFFSMGFGLLVIVRGAMELPRVFAPRPRAAMVAGFTLTGFLIMASVATVPGCYALPKQDFVGARDYVEQNRQPQETVVAVGMAGLAYKRYFAPHWMFAQTEAEMKSLRKWNPNLVVVYSLPVELKAFHPGIWEIVQHDFTTVRIFRGSLGGGDVYVCRPRQIVGHLLGELELQ